MNREEYLKELEVAIETQKSYAESLSIQLEAAEKRHTALVLVYKELVSSRAAGE